MKRRDFLTKAAVGGAMAAAATVAAAPAVMAQDSYNWKMVTTWPPKMPILQIGAERFAQRVEEMSNGRMKIQVYAAGELVPALGTFDAVSSGTVECGSGAAYYWAGKEPAVQWFSSVPFGLNAQGLNSWFYAGDGLKLWEEVYAPFNLVPRPQGNTGVQMGGWFNKELFEALPADMQAILATASEATDLSMSDEFTARNSLALKELMEVHGVTPRKFPDDLLRQLRDVSRQVIDELGQISPLAQRIHASYHEFETNVTRYHAISEEAYNDARDL